MSNSRRPWQSLACGLLLLASVAISVDAQRPLDRRTTATTGREATVREKNRPPVEIKSGSKETQPQKIPLTVNGSTDKALVTVTNNGGGAGISGTAPAGRGVEGSGTVGVSGSGGVMGVSGLGTGNGTGVSGTSNSGIGVLGYSVNGPGVQGRSRGNQVPAIIGESDEGPGVRGNSTSDYGVAGYSRLGLATGVYGSGQTGVRGEGHTNGVAGYSDGVGVYGESRRGTAGYFNGTVVITTIPPANGADRGDVCFGNGGVLMACRSRSSLRFKTNVHSFRLGLDIVQRLHPISFNWKEGGRPDIGLSAEDVAQVAPSFVTTNDKGEVEGVKYDRLNIVLINAVKEQQNEIEKLLAENAALNTRLRNIERTLRKEGRSRQRR